MSSSHTAHPPSHDIDRGTYPLMTYCLMLAIVDDDVDDDDGDNDDGDSTDDDDGDGEDTIALRNGVSKDRSTAGQSI